MKVYYVHVWEDSGSIRTMQYMPSVATNGVSDRVSSMIREAYAEMGVYYPGASPMHLNASHMVGLDLLEESELNYLSERFEIRGIKLSKSVIHTIGNAIRDIIPEMPNRSKICKILNTVDVGPEHVNTVPFFIIDRHPTLGTNPVVSAIPVVSLMTSYPEKTARDAVREIATNKNIEKLYFSVNYKNKKNYQIRIHPFSAYDITQYFSGGEPMVDSSKTDEVESFLEKVGAVFVRTVREIK